MAHTVTIANQGEPVESLKLKSLRIFVVLLVIVSWLAMCDRASAQVSASIVGKVEDSSGAGIPAATVTVTNLETGATRVLTTDDAGNYQVLSLAVGLHQIRAEKSGFNPVQETGINLVVGQQAVVNLRLGVQSVQQQVTVTTEGPLINTTTASVSGLVGEEQVKDLPLNGRSFDNLITLNPGAINFTTNRNGGLTGGGNYFSVGGKRPSENLFLLNGVEYTGASLIGVTPGGVSGQLLGIDAVREFNVVSDTYSAEYGKKTGAQVSVVTQSGTNTLHGSAFEFLRNSALDARNFFDNPTGRRIPPFERNQFGGALGGPIRKDRTFIFGNYEGFRQRLGLSDVTFVPDDNARAGMLPCGVITPLPSGCAGKTDTTPATVPGLNAGMLAYMAFWPEPNSKNLGQGVAVALSNPKQSIREDFGTARVDQIFSERDSFSGSYTIDDGFSVTPMANPFFATAIALRMQTLSLQETHIFSPQVINTFTAGFSRGAMQYATPPLISLPANLSFVTGREPGNILIGGGAAGASAITSAGGASNPLGYVRRTLFTYADGLQVVRGIHQISAGAWFQRIRSDEEVPNAAVGQASFSTLQSFLQGTAATFVVNAVATPQNWRSWEGAWYLQDSIQLKPNLNIRIGLRDEFTTGWNEVTGRAAIFQGFDDTGALLTAPQVVSQIYPKRNSNLGRLWGPRVGLAWDPFRTGKTAVRAGWGIYYDLIDTSVAAGSTDSNPPFNGAATFANVQLLSLVPFDSGAPLPIACGPGVPQPCTIYLPKGVDPNLRTPTVNAWNLAVEQELSPNTSLRVAYVGSYSYHEIINLDANAIAPQICSAPAGCASGGVGKTTGTVTQGTEYIPVAKLPNPFLSVAAIYFFEGKASYNALQLEFTRRLGHGLQFRANYTYSRNLDYGSGLGSSQDNNAAQTLLNPYQPRLDWGRSPLDITHQASGNLSYELPFGRGKRWAKGVSGVADKLVSGWQLNNVVTVLSGFSFSPVIGSNRSGNGDTIAPDRPSSNPAFTGPVIVGSVNEWFNPNAYVLPTPGTFGDVRRATLTGPGLAEVDSSLFKTTKVSERLSLQFRAEFFNIANHANFRIPNTVVFSGNSISPSAGIITATATTSRQIQFGMKLIF
jgi:hypothetical protein